MIRKNNLNIKELLILEPEVYNDKRGYFYESYNKRNFEKILKKKINFVQDNESSSKKGVLRGLHYQRTPFSQGKLIKVTKGKIFDVAVDLRKNSKSFGKYFSVILSEKNKKQLWIPKGFAHGFLSLSNDNVIQYKTTNYYSPKHEITIRWDDEKINVKWPIQYKKVIISKKDKNTSISLSKFVKLK